LTNAASSIVYEYTSKMSLRKLGYVFDARELDVFTSECFLIIASEISNLEAKEIKASRKGR
jgi:hypothetical protein